MSGVVNHLNTPSFHGQGLPFGPKPSEIDGENKEQKSLQAVPVV
jgi:hypothetical protein